MSSQWAGPRLPRSLHVARAAAQTRHCNNFWVFVCCLVMPSGSNCTVIFYFTGDKLLAETVRPSWRPQQLTYSQTLWGYEDTQRRDKETRVGISETAGRWTTSWDIGGSPTSVASHRDRFSGRYKIRWDIFPFFLTAFWAKVAPEVVSLQSTITVILNTWLLTVLCCEKFENPNSCKFRIISK